MPMDKIVSVQSIKIYVISRKYNVMKTKCYSLFYYVPTQLYHNQLKLLFITIDLSRLFSLTLVVCKVYVGI